LIIGNNTAGIIKNIIFLDFNKGYQTELDLLFNDVPHDLRQKLLLRSLADFTSEEIIKLPTSLIYFLPVSKLNVFIRTLI